MIGGAHRPRRRALFKPMLEDIDTLSETQITQQTNKSNTTK